MKSVFLIEHDNQQGYEDYRTTAVCVCNTRQRAEQVVTELIQWVIEAAKALPPLPDADADDDAYSSKYATRKVAIDKLVAPYDCQELVADVRNYPQNQDVTDLYIYEIPVVENVT